MIVVGFQQDQSTAFELHLDVGRCHPKVSGNADMDAPTTDREADRIGRIMGSRKWGQVEGSDRKGLSAVESRHPIHLTKLPPTGP